jgi:excisionase family DNA binding protein
MNRNTSPAMQGERMLSVRETAEIRGCCLDTVRRDLREGKMPGVKTGRNWRVPESQLMSYFEQGQNDFHSLHPKEAQRESQPELDHNAELIHAMLRTEAGRLRVMELAEAALTNCDVKPKVVRQILSHLSTLLSQI